MVSLALIVAGVLVSTAIDGGRLEALLQPVALMVVVGGTAAATLLSFPWPVVRRTWAALGLVFRVTPEPDEALIGKFEHLAVRVIRKGVASVETEAAVSGDPFLATALGMVADGVPSHALEQALTSFSRAREDAEDESAVVLETAAGYAPTLGILGAVLGLISVMENLATPAGVGAGIAVAFVATVYGVGLANLLLLPMASRLRAVGRTAALRRELIIHGAVILREAVHPRLVETHLAGFIRSRRTRPKGAA